MPCLAKKRFNIYTARHVEIASATTGAKNTPSNFKNNGKISTNGITNSTWRDKLKNAAFNGLLIAWKKLVASTCNGINGSSKFNSRITRAESVTN